MSCIFFSFQADYKEVFSGISNVEEVAFNALSFVWNPTEEAKVNTPLSPKEGLFFFSFRVVPRPCQFSEGRRNRWKVLKEKTGKAEEGGREREWLGRNPRNVFSPEAPVNTAGEGRDASFVWLKGAEVGPPNLLQVEAEEQRDSSKYETRED